MRNFFIIPNSHSLNPEVVVHFKRNFFANLLDAGFWFLGDSFVAAYTILPVFMSTLTDSPIMIGLIPALEGAGWFLPQLFMAMISGRIDENKMVFAGGGLPPALIHRAENRKVEEISLKGFPLGCVAKYSYRQSCIELSVGDTVMFMTDGFPELFNSKPASFKTRVISSSIFRFLFIGCLRMIGN